MGLDLHVKGPPVAAGVVALHPGPGDLLILRPGDLHHLHRGPLLVVAFHVDVDDLAAGLLDGPIGGVVGQTGDLAGAPRLTQVGDRSLGNQLAPALPGPAVAADDVARRVGPDQFALLVGVPVASGKPRPDHILPFQQILIDRVGWVDPPVGGEPGDVHPLGDDDGLLHRPIRFPVDGPDRPIEPQSLGLRAGRRVSDYQIGPIHSDPISGARAVGSHPGEGHLFRIVQGKADPGNLREGMGGVPLRPVYDQGGGVVA